MSKKTDKMVQELYAFADRDDSLVLREFIQKQKLSYSAFCQILELNPALKEAFEYARLAIGIRREKLGLSNALNAKLVSDSMPLYDEERREWEIKKLKIQNLSDLNKAYETIQAIVRETKDESKV